ncbi:gag/pol protein [Cucumis melo var. makuwa]|nr:gag/pol protein [Cucumis melo var. makuwa]
MDALRAMLGQPEWSLRHEAIKYIYTKRMKDWTSVREHVLDMMMHFNIVEVNGSAIDEANQVSFILESLPKSFIPFQTNASLNKKEFNLTTLLNELQRFQTLTMGYPKESRGGLFYNPQENKVFVSTNTTFLEEDHIRDHQPYNKLVLNEISKSATDKPSSSTKVVDKTKISGQTHPSQELREPQCIGRVVHQPDRYLGLSETQVVIPDDGVEDPLTYKQAMNDVDCDQWIKAMNLEMESMFFNSVWTLVDQPNDVKPIGCKWIYKRKRDQAGKVQTFKARLVAKGYTQREEVDYKETFSHVAMLKSIRILLSIATFYDYEIWQMDVKTTFLNENLEESIYMAQPEGFIKKGYLTNIKKWLATQFQMKDLEDAQYVLGIQIVRNRKNRTLAMPQASYVDKMLSRYKMQNFKKGRLLYRYGHVSKEQCPKTPQEVEDMRKIHYASVVGSLMYAMLCIRLDICFSVGMVSRCQSNPGRDHWTTVKNILKYLRRTKDYMLVYGTKDRILAGYTDSDFQTDKDARKSTSGSIFTLNGGAVIWRSVKQTCIVDSIMEAEYVAACEATKETVWLRKFLTDLEIVPNMHLSITLYCANSGTVSNS